MFLPHYYIARYPVTVAQFQAFVEKSGYELDINPGLHGLGNHPVVGVTWCDALQYCDWLTGCLRTWEGTPEPLASLLRDEGWRVHLPSEAEWEKAARGTDGRLYPWGNKPDPNRANFGGTDIHSTSAVGCFPQGASPYGVEEMSGNVWEWTRSLWGDYPYPTEDAKRAQRENPQAPQRPVLRGGAFFDDPRYVRCAYRYWDFPGPRSDGVGFRVVLLPPHDL